MIPHNDQALIIFLPNLKGECHEIAIGQRESTEAKHFDILDRKKYYING